MQDLILYLESNGFHPRTEDLESILRRCDHDADRALSFEEFCEVIEVAPELNEAEILEDNGIVLDGNKETTLKKDLKESVNTSSLRKRRNSNELDGEPKENIEEAQDRKEAEARIAKMKEERKLRYESISQLVKFVQDKLTVGMNLENQKRMLQFHRTFSAVDLFREMDKDGNGYLTSKEFEAYFEKDDDF